MLKTRIILVSIALLAVFILFRLPRSVVKSEGLSDSEITDEKVEAKPDPHIEAPESVKEQIKELIQNIGQSNSNQKNAIFADSLANLYRVAGKFDSAAWYAESAAEHFNEPKYWLKTAENYYEAYTFAFDEAKQKFLAEKSREYFAKALASDPSNLEAKTKMAMTYLSGSNPMQGITMLREVLEVDPENISALFNLGMLSLQSRQFERAVERFEQVLSLEPTHSQAMLLLGVAHLNSGNKAKAREVLENLKVLDKDPAVQATVDSYLRDLKK
jgi:outer membrane protein